MPAVNDPTRVRDVSFMITSTFEGGSYAAYQNTDRGIVSYGLFQFTLAGSSLYRVVKQYTDNSDTDIARQMRAYLGRIQSHDEGLRHDDNLKRLLKEAAKEDVMKQAQRDIAQTLYYDRAQSFSIKPRGIVTPLGQALFFDLAIHYGPAHSVGPRAEENLGVEHKSRLGENGITEEQLIREMVRIRKADHYYQAERDGLPGLKRRGDFWFDIVERGDWNIIGDEDGDLMVAGTQLHVWDPSESVDEGTIQPKPTPPGRLPGDPRIVKAAFAVSTAFEGGNVDGATMGDMWRASVISALKLGLKEAYSYALLFDIAVEHGIAEMERLVHGAEDALGGAVDKSLAENDISESLFIGKLAGDSKTTLYRKADATHERDLRKRADFWIARYAAQDWAFEGDTDGAVDVLGNRVQIKNPA